MSKSKVTKVEFQREWKNPKFNTTIYYFTIEFEDGIKGEFSTSKKDQNKFLVGQEYNYTVTVKKSDAKGEYNFIEKPKEQDNKSEVPGKKWKRDPAVRRLIIAQSCQNDARMSIIFLSITYPELGIGDRVDVAGINAIANKYYDWITANASDNEQMEIICQSMLSSAIECIPIKKLELKSTDTILALAKLFIGQILARASVNSKEVAEV